MRRVCTAAAASRRALLGAPDASLVGAVRGGTGDALPPAPDVQIWPEIISEAEESALVAEAERWLARRAFEPGHFDGVIRNYREQQQPLGRVREPSRALLQKLSAAAVPGAEVLPVHVLELAADGVIGRHVDHVEYSGGTIAGLSLVSSAVMTLHHEGTDAALDLTLPPRSLYALSGAARYEWGHSLVPAGRRIAMLFRDRAET